jgi:hypothetical protein
MESDASNRDPTAPRVKKRSKKVPPATALPHSVVSGRAEGVPGGSVSREVVPPHLDGREPAAIGWAHGEPPQVSAGSLGTGTATYRVVITCGLDRRGSASSG